MIAKLDRYDYEILVGIVRIHLESSNDPTMVDILSDVERSNGKFHVDGQYFLMYHNELFINRTDGTTWLDIYTTNAE